MCNNWPDFPTSLVGATGGLIKDTVIICGGFGSWWNSSEDECYSLTSEKTTLVTHMSVGRTDAASIVFNDNALWVTGGSYNNVVEDVGTRLASTEYVTVTKTMPGSDLPMALSNHAMVAINSTCSMVIGGHFVEEGANYCLFLFSMVKYSEYLFLFSLGNSIFQNISVKSSAVCTA